MASSYSTRRLRRRQFTCTVRVNLGDRFLTEVIPTSKSTKEFLAEKYCLKDYWSARAHQSYNVLKVKRSRLGT
jgi:hypothetical protein